MSAKLADILMPSPMITIEDALLRLPAQQLRGRGCCSMATAMAQSVAAALGT